MAAVLPQAAEQGVVMADHAGFYETALLMAAKRKLVDLDPAWMGRAVVYCARNQQGA